MRDPKTEIQRLRERAEARKRRRESYADLFVKMREIMTKQLQREIRASKRKAA